MAKASSMFSLASDEPQKQQFEMVDSRDHDLHMAYQKVLREGTEEAHQMLEKEVEHRQFFDKLFSKHFDEHIQDAP